MKGMLEVKELPHDVIIGKPEIDESTGEQMAMLLYPIRKNGKFVFSYLKTDHGYQIAGGSKMIFRNKGSDCWMLNNVMLYPWEYILGDDFENLEYIEVKNKKELLEVLR